MADIEPDFTTTYEEIPFQPSAADVEILMKSARNEGYRSGLHDGFKSAHNICLTMSEASWVHSSLLARRMAKACAKQIKAVAKMMSPVVPYYSNEDNW